MKKILYIAFIGLCFAFQSAFCQSQWQDVESSSSTKLFLDTSSLKATENFLYYRAKFDYGEKSSICWIKSDCNKNLTSVLECRPYSKSSENNFFTYENSTKMKSFKSTSAVRQVHNSMCQFHEKEKQAITEQYYGNVDDETVISQNDAIENASSADSATVEDANLQAPKAKKQKVKKSNTTKLSNTLDKLSAIPQALELLKNCPLTVPYDILSGNNPYFKPVIVEFRKLADVDKASKDFDAISWLKDETLYIFIDTKHSNAPKEAIAALIAGRSIHVDNQDSINEEIYAWAVEGFVWKYLTKDTVRNPEIPLVQRELVINSIMDKAQDGSSLKKFVNSNKGYTGLNKTSLGFEQEEFDIKFNELLELYKGL